MIADHIGQVRIRWEASGASGRESMQVQVLSRALVLATFFGER
jgi:hypothetical protein